MHEGQSPSVSAQTFAGPHGFYLPLNGSDPSHKRTRPLTQHQLAVEQYRRRRVEVILDRRLRIEYKESAKRRRKENAFVRSWIRCKGMQDGYDTDEESHIQAIQQQDIEVGTKTPPPIPAGLVPIDFGGEINDHGEEAYHRSKMLTRALRRMDRWENGRAVVRSGKAKHDEIASTETANGAAAGMQPIDEDADEEMQDVDDALERGDDIDTEEDEDMDRSVYDPNTLPPLPV